LASHAPNFIRNCVDVLVQLLITEAKETKAARGEPVSTALIVLGRVGLQMLRTVEFNDDVAEKQTKSTMSGPIAA
jgi:hypothetical protein